MAISPFRKVKAVTDEVKDLQNAVARVFLELIPIPLLSGRHIKGIRLTTTLIAIEHGLGREWVGWIITKQNGAKDIWTSNTVAHPKNKFLELDASGTVDVDIWVF